VTAPGRWLDRDGVAAALAAGEVVLLETDTLPGLHARLDRPAALAAIAERKGRAAGKPLLVLAGSLEAALALTAPLAAATRDYLTRCWPGPITAVLPAIAGLPAAVAPKGTVAVRVPEAVALRDLLVVTGPLASTSANRSGEPPALELADAIARFPGLAVWRDLAGATAGAASALVDLTGPRPRLLRAGPRDLPAWPDDA